MATISSVGVGTNGLDVKNIISQLVELERRPLNTLKLDASATQAKISAFGQIKSLVSTLSDAAGKLTSLTGWNGVTVTTSNDKAVTATAIGGTQPTSFNVEVQSLAKAHSTASGPISPPGSAVGAGTLTLWTGATAATPPATDTKLVDITVSATDTLNDIASKINGSSAGISATVLNDASGQRLLLSSKATGAAAAFHMTVADADGNNTDAAGLSRLVSTAFPPGTTGFQVTQAGADAKATVNGIAVTSATNAFKDTVSGVTFTAVQVTTGPVQITVAPDTATIQGNIKAFVDAYNAINDLLNEATKYDAAAKKGGMLQGDSTTITLQNSLRNAMQALTSGSATFKRLSDVGIAQLRGGDLSIDSGKLSTAMNGKMDDLKNLFYNPGTGATAGIAVQVKALTTNLLSVDGFFQSKDGSLQRSLKQNAKDQARVQDKVDAFEKNLTRQYNALDSKMSSLNALNAYVAQQVTTWNKTSG
ncbi:flagellar hook-associated protein 2 [Comamonas phosphati]|nr:flagellar hook-associated protein 2 [Comamonas phosphati]